MTSPQAFLMIGPPGAGKTTFARKLSANTGATHIEADEVHRDAGGDWNALQDGILEKIEDHLPKDIILDGTHCDRFQRRMSTDLLMSHGYEVTAVLVSTPLETCLLRNATRSRLVPRHIVIRWKEGLDRHLTSIPTEPFKEVITVY